MEIIEEGIGKGKWAIRNVDDLVLLSKTTSQIVKTCSNLSKFV